MEENQIKDQNTEHNTKIMTNENLAQDRVIDMEAIFLRIKENWKRISLIVIITCILSILIIVPVPRYYTTVTKVAPETESASGVGAISSLASSFGFDLGDAVSSTDAISPLLYPDLMLDNGFISKLFEIKITTCDGELNTTYYDYLANHQKKSWIDYCAEFFKKFIPTITPPAIKTKGGNNGFDPYILDKRQFEIMELIRDNVNIEYDKQTSLISIEVTDQDRIICKYVADSIRGKLLNFITEYRTSKARKDVEYYTTLSNDAKKNYEKARRDYASFSDANTDIGLPSLRSQLDELENDMQLKYNSYTAISTQLQAAQASLQERTPAFTLLQGAEVPIKPAGPKRMIFIAALMVLSFIISSLWISRDLLISKE